MSLRSGLLFVSVLALLRGLLLAMLTPPFAAADEPAHFDYVQRLAEHGRLPDLGVEPCHRFSAEGRALEAVAALSIAFRPDRPLPPIASFGLPDPLDPASRQTTGCGPAEHYPPLYYASSAAGYRFYGHGPLLQRIFGARLASVGWGALTAVFAFLAGWWWFGRPRDALLLGLVVVCQPVSSFFSSVVNNDAALFACAAGTFAATAWIWRSGPRGPALLLLATSATCGAMAKPTFTFFLPIFAACCVCALGPRRWRAWGLTALALAPAAVSAVAWWVFVRRGVGRALGLPPRSLPWGEFVSRAVLDSDRFYAIWVKQYWMAWGWLDATLADPYYRAILLSLALATIGVAVCWRRLDRDDRRLALLTAGCTVYALTLLYVMEREVVRRHGIPFIQGRYLVPLLPLHAAVLVAGLRALSRTLRSALDSAWLFVAVLVLVDAAAVARTLVRYYS